VSFRQGSLRTVFSLRTGWILAYLTTLCPSDVPRLGQAEASTSVTHAFLLPCRVLCGRHSIASPIKHRGPDCIEENLAARSSSRALILMFEYPHNQLANGLTSSQRTELCVAFASTATTRFSIHPILCRIEVRWVQRSRCGTWRPFALSVVLNTFVMPCPRCHIIYHLVFTFRLCIIHISTPFWLPAEATKAWERGVNDSNDFSMIDNPKGASAHKLPLAYLPGDFSKSERMHIHLGHHGSFHNLACLSRMQLYSGTTLQSIRTRRYTQPSVERQGASKGKVTKRYLCI
jgi:hypothetical protein